MFRSPCISDAVRVLLLALADDMTESGRVSVPRAKLMTKINRSERRVGDRLTAAVGAGLLDRVAAGRKGHTAVYAATLPGRDSGTIHSALTAADGVPL